MQNDSSFFDKINGEFQLACSKFGEGLLVKPDLCGQQGVLLIWCLDHTSARECLSALLQKRFGECQLRAAFSTLEAWDALRLGNT